MSSSIPQWYIGGGTAIPVGPGSNLSVIGSGLWHSTASGLDLLAYVGTNNQIVVTNSTGNNTIWVTLGPDISYASNVWTVKGLQGFSVANTTPGNAQVLTWSSASNSWGPQSLASMGFVTNTAVTGTGLWFTSTGSLTGSASLGTADQVLATSHAGTGLSWYTPSGDATFSQGVFTTIGLQGFAVANTTPTSNQVLTYNGSSWIPATFNSQNNFPYLYRGEFGDGSDANVTFDGVSSVVGFTGPVANVYTQTRAVYFHNATLSSNIKIYQAVALGYIHVRDTFTWNGTVEANGAAGAGITAGANPASFSGGNGGAGGNGNTGVNATTYSIAYVSGGSGGNGGGGAAGAAGAGYVSGATILTGLRTPYPWMSGIVVSSNLATSNVAASEYMLFGGTGGGGGSGGIGSGAGFSGGGGGAGGGISGVFARVLTGNGTQQAIGGAGGAGGASNCGGGGGGGGGTCLIVYGDKSGWTGSQSSAGGAGGAGAGGGGAGVAGNSGTTYMIGQLG